MREVRHHPVPGNAEYVTVDPSEQGQWIYPAEGDRYWVSGPARYLIELEGCDATTRLVITLNPAEVEVVRLLVDETKRASEYGCEPRMSIRDFVTPMDPEDMPYEVTR